MSEEIEKIRLALSPSIPRILKCETQAKNCTEKLKDFYEQTQFFDTVLIAGVDEVKFYCHRVILAASCDYFLTIFRDVKHEETDELTFENVDGPTLKLVLDFMYTSSVELCNDTVRFVLKVATFFKMETLITICSDYMTEQLEPNNCLGVTFFAQKHNYTELYEKALAFALTLFEGVSTSHEFLQLTERQLGLFLASDDLCVDTEVKVFRSIIAWVEHNKVNREQFIFKVLHLVRFELLTPEFITEHTRPICKTAECFDLIQNWLKWHSTRATRQDLAANPAQPRRTFGDIVVVCGRTRDELQYLTFNRKYNRWSYADWPLPVDDIRERQGIIINKKLVLLGGLLGELRTQTRCVHCLDLHTMEWSQYPRMSEPRHQASVCELYGQLYIMGGMHDNYPHSRTMERFDFSINSWETLAPFPAKCPGIMIASLNGLVYGIGQGDSRLYCYDPAANEWSQKADRVSRLNYFCMAGVKRYLYIIGGVDKRNKTTLVERYDPIGDSWSVMNPLGVKRAGLGCTVFNDRIIVCGGTSLRNDQEKVEEYNPDTNTWENLADMLPSTNTSDFFVMKM